MMQARQLFVFLLLKATIAITSADMTKATCSNKDLNDQCFQTYLARGAHATSSSVLALPVEAPSNMVDGKYVPVLVGNSKDNGYYVNTAKETSPYVQIDLGANMCINGVKIWNRSNDRDKDYHGLDILSRFRNALISVAESATSPGFGTRGSASECNYHDGHQGALRYYPCSKPMFGRYVRVTGVNMNDKLNLYEVEVHGWATDLNSSSGMCRLPKSFDD